MAGSWGQWVLVCVFLVLFPKWKRLAMPGKDTVLFSGLFMNILDFSRAWFDFVSPDHDTPLPHVMHARGDPDATTLYVAYHSRCSLDLFLIVATLRPTILLSHLAFRIPGASAILAQLGAIPSKSELFPESEATFVRSLVGRQVQGDDVHEDSGDYNEDNDSRMPLPKNKINNKKQQQQQQKQQKQQKQKQKQKPVLLLPGGHHEFAKSSSERYTVLWKEEAGFARVMSKHALTKVRVVPVFTANCESVYHTTDAWYDATSISLCSCLDDVRLGRLYKLPYLWLLVILSLGNVLLPRRVRMAVCFGEPLRLAKDESAIAFTRRVRLGMETLISTTQNCREYTTETGEPQPSTSVILPQHYFFTAVYTIAQNVLIVGFVLLCIVLSIVPSLLSYAFSSRVGSTKEKSA